MVVTQCRRGTILSPVIGILSDAHGNSRSFERGIQLLLNLGASHLYYLGDAIGYVPSLSVLDSISNLGLSVQCTMGNHEAMLLSNSIVHQRDAIYQLNSVKRMITPNQLDIISHWPSSLTQTFGDIQVLFLHGSPSDPIYGYVYPDTDLSTFSVDANYIFMGNTHHPFIRNYAGTTYVNVGSCGMPRDDGRYGSVSLLDTTTRTVRILRFDISEATDLFLQEHSSVHHSVRSVFSRRRSSLVGEIV